MWVMSLVGGLFLMFLIPCVLLFEHSYWRPVRVGGSVTGIEDPLNLVILGASTTLLALLTFRKRIRLPPPAVAALVERGAVAAVPATVFRFSWMLEAHVLNSSILANLVGCATILALRKDIWPVPVLQMMVNLPVYWSAIHLW